MHKIPAFCTFVVACAAALSATTQPEVHLIGLSLPKAKAALVSAGWRPVESTKRMADGALEKEFGDANLLLLAGYTEVESCTGTSLNFCRLNYLRDAQCLTLVTQGEWYPPNGIPKVHHIEVVCP